MKIQCGNNFFKVIIRVVESFLISKKQSTSLRSPWLQNWANFETSNEVISFIAVRLRFDFFQEAICNCENEVRGRWLSSSHDCERTGLPARWPASLKSEYHTTHHHQTSLCRALSSPVLPEGLSCLNNKVTEKNQVKKKMRERVYICAALKPAFTCNFYPAPNYIF